MNNQALNRHGFRFDIIFVDIDGTLLNSEKRVSEKTLAMLQELRACGIPVVLATGRSFFSLQKVIAQDFPADFFIVSSGAGIIESRSGELLFTQPLTQGQVKDISKKLQALNQNFMIHGQVPHNHKFVYHRHGPSNDDFERRLALYQDYCCPCSKLRQLPKIAAQIIVIMEGDHNLFVDTAGKFSNYQVIRSTSPLDHQSIWMEIFPKGVSKGAAARWLCDYLGIDYQKTLGIGNDYNDIELLDFTALSYMVANAPAELKERYGQTSSNDNHGVYQAIINNTKAVTDNRG